MKKTGTPVEGFADGEEPLVYHYGKPGERLRNADESVRKMYEELEANSNRGFFRCLVQTRSSRFLLLMIALLVIIIFAVPFLGSGNKSSLAGIPVQLSAFSFDGIVYVSLKLQDTETLLDSPAEISANFSAYSADDQLLFEADSAGFYGGAELFLRTSFTDYDIVYVEAVVSGLDSTISLRCKVTKN